MGAERLLDLETGLSLTAGDLAALRRLREQTPSWLEWDWRTLVALVPRDVLAKRATAAPDWQPFRLDTE